MRDRYKSRNKIAIISFSFILFFLFFISFFEIFGYKLVKHNFYYSSIEERLLSGIKTSKNSNYYNGLYSLLKNKNYTKFEKCLRFNDKFNCKFSNSSMRKYFSNEDYSAYFNNKYPELMQDDNKISNFKKNFTGDNKYILNSSESRVYVNDKAKWNRENDVLNSRYYNDQISNYERIINPPIRKSKYTPTVNGNFIIDILAFSDSFGEGAGNFDRDINWVSVLEKKLNSLDKPYKFRISQVSNIGANYSDYYKWSFNYLNNEKYSADLFLLSFHNNDLHSYAEIENENSIIPKATLRYIKCMNNSNYKLFLEKILKNTLFILDLLKCENVSEDGFLNIDKKVSLKGDKFIDYNEILFSYDGFINNLDKSVFLFDLDFITLDKEVSYSSFIGDFNKSDFFGYLKDKGYLFVDNYKKISFINSYLEKCKFSYCDSIVANYFDGHFSNILLNAIIESNVDAIYDKFVFSFSKESLSNVKGLEKNNINYKEILLDNVSTKYSIVNNEKLRILHSDALVNESNLDTALCVSLGREHVRIGLDAYQVLNRDISVKFNVFEGDLLFAIGGYDSFGNQVISDFIPIDYNTDYIFKGSEERRVLFIAEKSLGCGNEKWSLPDLSFDLEFIS